MRPLALLVLTLPFGAPAHPESEWRRVELIGGLTALVGPARVSKISFSGLTMTVPVKLAGGEGAAEVRQGSSRDIKLTVHEADVREVVQALGGELPDYLRMKLVGKIGELQFDLTGSKFTLKAKGFRIPNDLVTRIEATGDLDTRRVSARIFALGGLIEYDGRLPEDQ